MIAIGDRVPDATLTEFLDAEREGCSPVPMPCRVRSARPQDPRIWPRVRSADLFAKHVPGYVAQAEALRAAGVDEVWCVSVNDAFVMGAWGREQQVGGKVRMMGDGSAHWTRALGLDQGNLWLRAAWACARRRDADR